MQHLQSNSTLQGGKYRIERVLGQGGFGITYLAEQTLLHKYVAIKEFFLKEENGREGSSVTMPNTTKQELFDGQKEKFKKEAARMFSIKNDHVIGVHDLFEENGTAYYVMDYVDGESLANRLERTGQPIPEKEVWALLPQILDALATVHKEKFCHLDIKPSNIMVDKTGHVKLIDFGASKQMGADGLLTTNNPTAFAQTPGYASPEQMEQNFDKMGPWTDFYALGATLYAILTNKKPPRPSDINDDNSADKHLALPGLNSASANMQGLVLRLLNPNWQQRPQSVEEIVTIINIVTIHNNKPKEELPDKTNETFGEDTIIELLEVESDNNAEKNTTFTNPNLGFPTHNVAIKFLWGVVIVLLLVFVFYWITTNLTNSIKKDETQLSSRSIENGRVKNEPIEDKKIDSVVCNIIKNMVVVEGGTFTMGATVEQRNDAWDNEYPAHEVIISSFCLNKYEVTQEEWYTIMGNNHCVSEDSNIPITQISWNDCQEFIKKLNSISHYNFRLPTEAEWEYAARGGRKSLGMKFSGSNNIESVGWNRENCNKKIHPVGELAPNELGLYDMSGNVSEFCHDWYANYSSQSLTNPQGPSSGNLIVIRGGSWIWEPSACRVSSRGTTDSDGRDDYYGDIGFRLAASLSN